MNFSVWVNVMPKSGVADPQGQTIESALPAVGFDGVTGVRVGKRIELSVDAPDDERARARAIEMCERLLANTVIESFEVGVGAPGGPRA
jgi:phosphoribosylformylglycinamidine synthase PurS subunit